MKIRRARKNKQKQDITLNMEEELTSSLKDETKTKAIKTKR